MKIRVSVTVDIDPAAWSEAWSVDPKNTRADVRRYVENVVRVHTSSYAPSGHMARRLRGAL